MLREKEEDDALFTAMQKANIPQIVVGYLKLQQAKNHDFFDLFIDNKINGRLFYNTCMPNGAKEVRYGNDDFMQKAFRNVIDDMLAPFNNVTIQEVRSEFIQPTTLSAKMNFVITDMLSHIESTSEWKEFWEREIQLQCSQEKKKALYNMVASNAAYKALVSCVDHSKYILDPRIKRNVAVLIGICTGKYNSPFLQETADFHFKKISAGGTNRFSVFKAPENQAEPVKSRKKTRIKKKTGKKRVQA